MTMMHHSMIESKAGVLEEVNAFLQMVEDGVGSGEATHVLEKSQFQRLLKLGGIDGISIQYR